MQGSRRPSKDDNRRESRLYKVGGGRIVHQRSGLHGTFTDDERLRHASVAVRVERAEGEGPSRTDEEEVIKRRTSSRDFISLSLSFFFYGVFVIRRVFYDMPCAKEPRGLLRRSGASGREGRDGGAPNLDLPPP